MLAEAGGQSGRCGANSAICGGGGTIPREELVRRYALPHADSYADACHLCYEARRALRARFPDVLAPDAMYGVPEGNDG